MSVQFGRWNFEGQPPAADYIEKVNAALARYGSNGNSRYSKGGVTVLYHAFHTTRQSWFEKQPYLTPSGAVITWDGRLDNRADLIRELRPPLSIDSADVVVVAAAYERWGNACLARLLGDWALSIWNPIERLLILAKDPIGPHHLYYSMDNHQVTWSSVLDPLVLLANKAFAISEEYVAGWLSWVPAAHLTPYVGIHAVAPSSSVLLRPGKRTVGKYWDFDPGKRIRYHKAAEYEEHFRTVFGTAVQRRLRSDRPVLAELSGGMDSSSIVCMADSIMARGQAECPRLDTISWYDESDPDWKEELFYFSKVEQQRNRAGYHIDLGVKNQTGQSADDSNKSFFAGLEGIQLATTPDSNHNLWPKFSRHYFEQYLLCLKSKGYRVTLSGIGGEEPTGGFVPTPRPELQNLLVRARFFELVQQLNAWAAKMRKSRRSLLWDAARGFIAKAVLINGAPTDIRPAPWLRSSFVKRNCAALCGYPSRTRMFGPLPSFQCHIHGLNHLQMVLARLGCLRLYSEMPREVRYPYLDRELLEFAFAIPPEQIVGVGKRRFLMKRALVGIVPDELLNRKQRSPVVQTLSKDTSPVFPTFAEVGRYITGDSLQIIDPNRFWEELQKRRNTDEVLVDGLDRTQLLEAWVRDLTNHGVLTNSMLSKSDGHSSSWDTQELQSSVQSESSAS